MGSATGMTYKPIYGSNVVGMGIIAFSFQTNGTGAIDQTTIRGNKVATVSRASAGTYTVTLDSGVYQVVAMEAKVFDLATASAIRSEVYIADETADPLVLTVYTLPPGSTTPTDYGPSAADTNKRRVSVTLYVKLSIG